MTDKSFPKESVRDIVKFGYPYWFLAFASGIQIGTLILFLLGIFGVPLGNLPPEGIAFWVAMAPSAGIGIGILARYSADLYIDAWRTWGPKRDK